MRRVALVLAMLPALALGMQPDGAAQEAGTAPGAALVEICTTTPLVGVPEVGPRACKSFDSGSVLFAQVCGQLPLPPEACANATDGRLIDPALVDAFEDSWVWRALRLQSGLDEAEPLRNSLWPHTHNSSNSTAHAPSLSNIDPNQRYSITDQLRMGIRGIELDLHWVPHATGTAETGGKAVVLCHGRSESVGPLTIHLGCSVDRVIAEGLAEIRAFLERPGNEREVVLLYLENQLEGDPLAHDLAAAALEAELGALVARPPADDPCASMPLDTSRVELLAAGHQVLIVGNCGPSAWGGWVHERGEHWDERGGGGIYPAFPACEADRAARAYDESFVRVYEDSTWLSAMVDGESHPTTVATTRAMVQCGVDLIGFDRLEPGDGRLAALVWSWAPDEPVLDPGRRCAAWGTDARFRAAGCADVRGFACRTDGGEWVVPDASGPWSDGVAVCESIGARFAVPSTGWQNELLRRRAAAGQGELWLDYQSHAEPGVWVVGIAGGVTPRIDLGTAVERAVVEGHDGKSGARLERVVLADGSRYVVKHAAPTEDLWIIASGERGDRELVLLEAGVLDRLPAGVGHALVDGWRHDDGTITLVMRDVGDAVVGWDRRLTRAECRTVLAAGAALHRTFAGEPVAGLCSLERRLMVMTPGTFRGLEGLEGAGELPGLIVRGWERLYDLAPDDVVRALDAVLAEPSLLAEPLRANGTTLVHGDFWLVNMALAGDDVVLLDWAIAADGPPAVDAVSFLAGNASQVDATREEILDDFRAVEGSGHDEGVLTAALLFGLIELGWNKALDCTEHDDPAERARHRADLDWWLAAARRTLDAGLL